MKWSNFALLGCLCALCLGAEGGCEPTPPESQVPLQNVPQSAKAVESEPVRFKVERYGQFRAGYGDNVREILIITDIQTKRQYLAVTDCGLQAVKDDEEARAEAIDTALDIAGSLVSE